MLRWPSVRSWTCWSEASPSFNARTSEICRGGRSKTSPWHLFLAHFVLLIQSFEVLPWHGTTLPSPWWRTHQVPGCDFFFKSCFGSILCIYLMWFYWIYWWQSSRNDAKWMISLLNVLATSICFFHDYFPRVLSRNFEFPDFDTDFRGEKRSVWKGLLKSETLLNHMNSIWVITLALPVPAITALISSHTWWFLSLRDPFVSWILGLWNYSSPWHYSLLALVIVDSWICIWYIHEFSRTEYV